MMHGMDAASRLPRTTDPSEMRAMAAEFRDAAERTDDPEFAATLEKLAEALEAAALLIAARNAG